jgi:hypothetical protein
MYCSIWNNERNNNPHLFKTVILNRHTTREEAYLDEQKWQVKLNVVESDLFVNRSVQTSTGFTTNGIAISDDTRLKLKKARSKQVRKPHSEVSKEKNRQSHLGKKASAETKAKQSKIQKERVRDPLSDETKAKISKTLTGKPPEENGMFGKKHSEETKIKMREAKARRKNG